MGSWGLKAVSAGTFGGSLTVSGAQLVLDTYTNSTYTFLRRTKFDTQTQLQKLIIFSSLTSTIFLRHRHTPYPAAVALYIDRRTDLKPHLDG